MIRNYLKIAWRNLLKSKKYTAINIIGLSIGLASFFVILLYLNYELSYDTWDNDLNRVYKVSMRSDEDILKRTTAPLASFLKENTASIEDATRISPGGSFELLLGAGEKQIYQRGTIEADSSFFKVFPYKLIQGDVVTALDKPNAMVISPEVAKKLFGKENPIGKTIKVYNSLDYEVTGIMKMPDKPSHLEVEVVYRSPNEKENFHWQNFSFVTYVKTKQVMSVNELEQIVDQIYYDHRIKKDDVSFQDFRKLGHLAGLFVDPVGKLHNFPKYGNSNIATVSILLVLATLLLLAGAVNFSNLSIASSIRRAKEVGVKKVLGSSRGQLFWQFMGEIAFQCLMSLGLALLLAAFILPYFNREFNISLGFNQTREVFSLFLQVLICLLIVIGLSGLYPAVFLSRYNVSNVLKGNYSRGSKGTSFRHTLVVVQFVVSAFFVMATIVISKQLQYMQTRDKGFSSEKVLRVQAMQNTREKAFEAVRNTLLNIPGIQHVSKTTRVPGDILADTSTVSFKYSGHQYRMESVKVSTDYFNTLGIELKNGRLFDKSQSDQNTRTAIVNETAAKKLGLQDIERAYISFPDCDSILIQVVGIVRDFNVSGFENQVQPAVYTIGNQACMYQAGGAILVKLSGNNIRQSIAKVEEVWKLVEPGFPIRYSFLDDDFQQLFVSHIRIQKIITFFGFTAVAIAMMGLFALTSFLVGQRTKEIGIRKVLGASVINLGTMLSKDFIRLIVIAMVVAIPISWWIANSWLKNFEYRVSLDGWLFFIAAIVIIVVALLIVGVQSIRAALSNPVNSLRDE